MRPRLSRTTVGLAVGITAAVSLACGAGAFLYSRHHFGTLLERERGTALAEGELMRAALEHQMIENDRSLIAQMVQRFGREPRVVNVMLLDRFGVVRHASAPVAADRASASARPPARRATGCPPDQRGSSRVIETAGGSCCAR